MGNPTDTTSNAVPVLDDPGVFLSARVFMRDGGDTFAGRVDGWTNVLAAMALEPHMAALLGEATRTLRSLGLRIDALDAAELDALRAVPSGDASQRALAWMLAARVVVDALVLRVSQQGLTSPAAMTAVMAEARAAASACRDRSPALFQALSSPAGRLAHRRFLTSVSTLESACASFAFLAAPSFARYLDAARDPKPGHALAAWEGEAAGRLRRDDVDPSDRMQDEWCLVLVALRRAIRAGDIAGSDAAAALAGARAAVETLVVRDADAGVMRSLGGVLGSYGRLLDDAAFAGELRGNALLAADAALAQRMLPEVLARLLPDLDTALGLAPRRAAAAPTAPTDGRLRRTPVAPPAWDRDQDLPALPGALARAPRRLRRVSFAAATFAAAAVALLALSAPRPAMRTAQVQFAPSVERGYMVDGEHGRVLVGVLTASRDDVSADEAAAAGRSLLLGATDEGVAEVILLDRDHAPVARVTLDADGHPVAMSEPALGATRRR